MSATRDPAGMARWLVSCLPGGGWGRMLGPCRLISHMGTPNDTDHVIAALAGRHRGLVNRRQLLAAGLSPKEIAVRVRARRLLPFYPGVYAVGHAELRREGHWLAAPPFAHGSARTTTAYRPPRWHARSWTCQQTYGRGPWRTPSRTRIAWASSILSLSAGASMSTRVSTARQRYGDFSMRWQAPMPLISGACWRSCSSSSATTISRPSPLPTRKSEASPSTSTGPTSA